MTSQPAYFFNGRTYLELDYILFASSFFLQADKNVLCFWDLLLWKDLFGKASSFSVDTFIA